VPSLSSMNANTVSLGGRFIMTKRVRVYKDDLAGWFTEFSGATNPLYRGTIFVYDEDGQPVTPVINTDFASGDTTTISAGQIAQSTGTAKGSIALISDLIAWVEIHVHASAGGDRSSQIARNLSAFIRRPNKSASIAQRNALPDLTKKQASPHIVSAVPTQGYAPLGYETMVASSGTRYRVTRSVDTTLSSAAAASASSVTLTDATGVTNGDIIGIANDDLSVTDWFTVSSAAGAPTVTLSGTLTGNCAAGNRAVFLDWT